MAITDASTRSSAVGDSAMAHDPRGFACERVDRPELPVLVARGELDLSAVALFKACVRSLIESGGATVAIDLSGVTFMDAASVGILVWARRLADHRGSALVLVSPSSRCQRVLDLVGAGELFEIRAIVPPLRLEEPVPPVS